MADFSIEGISLSLYDMVFGSEIIMVQKYEMDIYYIKRLSFKQF